MMRMSAKLQKVAAIAILTFSLVCSGKERT